MVIALVLQIADFGFSPRASSNVVGRIYKPYVRLANQPRSLGGPLWSLNRSHDGAVSTHRGIEEENVIVGIHIDSACAGR